MFPKIDESTERDSSITHVLRRLESQEKIAIIERGSGKRPSLYSLLKPNEIELSPDCIKPVESDFIRVGVAETESFEPDFTRTR